MEPEEIKRVLAAYRPGCDHEADPRVRAALRAAAVDAELGAWLADRLRADAILRDKLRSEAPAALRDAILVGTPVNVIPFEPRVRSRAVVLALAASILVLATVVTLLVQSGRPPEGNFAQYRETMSDFVARDYTMMLQTRDQDEIRDFLRNNQAPADYQLSPLLEARPGVGTVVLSWNGHPVSLVCLESEAGRTLFLFIVETSAIPGKISEFEAENSGSLGSAVWSAGDQTYLLLGAEDAASLRRYAL